MNYFNGKKVSENISEFCDSVELLIKGGGYIKKLSGQVDLINGLEGEKREVALSIIRNLINQLRCNAKIILSLEKLIDYDEDGKTFLESVKKAKKEQVGDMLK